ncbi:primase-helicase family protein [Methylorubrum extorquens]|nr:primase-helicase family protein [Methylorubrum extorquens]
MNATNDMVRDEADQHYAALGLKRGTVKDMDEVKAARNKGVKDHHPDRPDGGSDAITARINLAYAWFKKITDKQPSFFTVEQLRRPSSRQSGPFNQWRQERQRSQTRQEDADRAESADRAETADTTDHADGAGGWEDAHYRPNNRSKTSEFMAEYLRIRGWRVSAGKVLAPVAGYKSYPTFPIGEVLRDVEITEERLQSELQDHLERQTNPGGGDVTKASIKSNFRAFIGAQADEERAKTFERLMVPLDSEQQDEAEKQWSILAAAVFEDQAAVAIAGLKKIFHQTKLKALRMTVRNHLVVVFYSKAGGPGKTEFSKLLTSPLSELRSGSTLLSDVVDKSNIDLFSQPIVLLDDMDKLDEKSVGAFKSVITSEYIDRRKFFKQFMVNVRQQAVFIGTANRPINELVIDPSGHRRFLMLTFRHLDHKDQKKIWGTINKINWELLWRSVSQDDEDPIEPVLAYMRQEDAKAAMNSPAGKLTRWFRNLDLSRPEVQSLAKGKRIKYYTFPDLFRLYEGSVPGSSGLMRPEFDRMLTEHCERGVGPFAGVKPTEFGRAFWPKQ